MNLSWIKKLWTFFDMVRGNRIELIIFVISCLNFYLSFMNLYIMVWFIFSISWVWTLSFYNHSIHNIFWDLFMQLMEWTLLKKSFWKKWIEVSIKWNVEVWSFFISYKKSFLSRFENSYYYDLWKHQSLQ